MVAPSWRTVVCLACVLGTVSAISACSDSDDDDNESKPDGDSETTADSKSLLVIGSVVINPEGDRTTYYQAIKSLDDGPFDNKNAIEIPGNGTAIADDENLYVGLTEEPTWVRYSINEDGKIEKTGSVSFLNSGASSIDYGNAIVDAHTAVSVISDPPHAIIWDPAKMEITGEVDLSDLGKDGYSLEVFATIAYKGLVYIPNRYANWDENKVYPHVGLTILDPKKMAIVGQADDDRCVSSGRPIFDKDGYAYVMGDGRNLSAQTFAMEAGEPPPPDNCLLRIAPGETDFEEDYYYTIPSLTDGRESITEIDTAKQGSGVAFTKIFYPDELPDGVKQEGFDYWSVPAHKLWQLELADPPTAEEVSGIPFGAIGFDTYSLDGKLYSGESPDGGESVIYEIDPEKNDAKERFTMQGYFYGLYRLKLGE